MPANHSCHVALTGSLRAWIEGEVAAGVYALASDVIRTANRVLRMNDQSKSVVQPAPATQTPRRRRQA